MSEPFRLTVLEPKPRRRAPAPTGDARAFLIAPPAHLGLSGGRSSAYMLRKILGAHGGRLPEGVHACFANTGKERPETLDFVAEIASRWGVNVRWFERDTSEPEGFREVDYETASRKGEPFEALIDEKHYLPNRAERFCTVELKLMVARAFMLAQGYEAWTNVVGLRRDEPVRVAKLAERNALGEQEWESIWPLYNAGVTKRDVTAHWAASDFDLQLEWWESNCDQCFEKKRAQRERIAREHPETVLWWAEQERKVGGRFIKDEPHGYAGMVDRIARNPPSSILLDESEDEDRESVACGCTDRQADRLRRCTCNKRAGRGHALHCRHVLGDEIGRAA